MEPRLKYLYILLFLLICCFMGCERGLNYIPIKKNSELCDASKVPFRGKWWNYYDRGLLYSKSRCWREAETDFRKALKKEDTDQRRLRTYGRHLTDYFAHRELGIALFYQKRYLDAIKELEESLETEISAKAEYYLDETRKLWIEQENLDASPPEIIIEKPGQMTLSNSFAAIVSGLVKDDTFVKEIFINNMPVRIDVGKPRIHFERSVPIQLGENRITIEGRDLAGKTVKRERIILCDRTGPVIRIDEAFTISRTHDGHIIRGAVHDSSGIREIRVNGLNILKDSVKEFVLNHVFLESGSEKPVVIVRDMAGNQTRIEITPSKLPDDRESHDSRDLLLASADLSHVMAFQNKVRQGAGHHAGNDVPTVKPKNRGASVSTGNRKKSKNCDELLGNYHALIIGINNYDNFGKLDTPVNDARGLKHVLVEQYDFKEQNITFCEDKDASKTALTNDLDCLARNLKDNDNLLIYFAGHGHFDKQTSEGFWIPVDGKPGVPETWIPHSWLKDFLTDKKLRAKNVLLISDSCYSGNLQASPIVAIYLASDGNPLKSAKKRSRVIITSGALEVIPDLGMAGHGFMAYCLIKSLKTNTQPLISIEELFNTSTFREILKASKTIQRPTLTRVKTEMDKGGLFVLHLKNPPVEDPPFTDVNHPVLKVDRWFEKKPVFLDQVKLEFKIYDDGIIQSIHINDEDIIDSNQKAPGTSFREFVDRDGNTVSSTSHWVGLIEGKNDFKIVCMDKSGKKTEKTVTIQKRLKKIYRPEYRMKVFVSPFTVKGKQADIESIFRERLVSSKRFNVLQQSNQKQPDEALRLARKLKADFLLIGEADADKKSLEIKARMIEVETEKDIIRDVYSKKSDLKQKEVNCQILVEKIVRKFPRVKGEIQDIRGDEVEINCGEKEDVMVGMHLVFFKQGKPDPDPETGYDFGSDVDVIGFGRVRELDWRQSYTEILDKKTKPRLEKGCPLIMK